MTVLHTIIHWYYVLVILIPAFLTCSVYGFVVHDTSSPRRTKNARRILPSILAAASLIDFQSDDSKFGRGEMHLSAMVQEGNVVVYQTGTWLVDGVLVGNDDTTQPPQMEYCRIESIQLVWTHNCEHGVLGGFAMHLEQGDDDNSWLVVVEPQQFVEFGPEQLVARLPVEWTEDADRAKSLVDLKGGSIFQPIV